ncbi:hypothetical protein ACFL5A_04575 [Gemmatimonadota bacterium]
MASRLSTFFAELKRRKVYHVGAAYAAVAVGVSLAVAELFGTFSAPEWAARAIIVVIALGFPIALVLAWAYEVKPEEPTPTTESDTDPPSAADSVGPDEVAVPVERSIVVLPFDNLSPDPDDAFFADGLTEELITDLSKVSALKVISRTSAMSFQGSNKTVPAIAAELDVRYALEGSVRRSGENLRITAQLIDTRTDDHLWAEKYTGTLEDVFDMQERTSRAIVDALEVRLTQSDEVRLAEQGISDARAYDLLIRARQEFPKGDLQGFWNAIDLLREAEELVGENLLIYAGLAEAYFLISHFETEGSEGYKGYMNEVRRYADRILQLDSESAYGNVYKAWVVWTDQRIQESFLLLNRAFDVDPNNVTVLWSLAFQASQFGQPKIAEACANRLATLDPLNPWAPFSQGFYWLVGEGKPELAVEPLRRAHEMAPSGGLFAFKYARALATTGEVEEACKVIDHIVENAGDLWVWFAPFFKHALRKERDEAHGVMTPERREMALHDPTLAWHSATGYALLGENDLALQCLEKSVDLAFINYPFLSEFDPLLEGIRQEPRFQKLMEKTKGIWEVFPDHPTSAG